MIEPAAASAAASRVPAREMAVRSRLGFGKIRARVRKLGEEDRGGCCWVWVVSIRVQQGNRLGRTEFDIDFRPIRDTANCLGPVSIEPVCSSSSSSRVVRTTQLGRHFSVPKP